MLAAIKVLILVCVPLSVTEPVPLPPTVTPLPVVAANVPAAADRVTVIGLAPESGSATLMPVSAVAVSWLMLCEAGAVRTGASLTLVRVIEGCVIFYCMFFWLEPKEPKIQVWKSSAKNV